MVDLLFNPSAEARSRKKGSILLLHPGATESSLQVSVTGFAESVGAKLFLCDRLSKLPVILPDIQNGISLGIFSLHFLDVIEASRLLHARMPLADIVFLCPVAHEEQLRLQLGPAPRIGSHWRCADPETPAFIRTLQVAYRGGEQRRTVRTTLDRFNARLASPPDPLDPLHFRKLIISDRFLATVLEHAIDAVLSVDTRNRVASLNPAAERLFSISQAEALNRPAASLAGDQWAEDLLHLLGEDQSGPVGLTLSLPTGAKNVEVAINPIQDEAGNRIASTMIIRDITERMLTENALRKSEALAATGRLAATVSHEINNPLEAVTNLLYLLAAESLSEDGREYLRLANLELERVSHIVKQTLTFYRSANRKYDEPFDAREAIDHILRIYAQRLANKSIKLITSSGPDVQLRMAKGDFQQVISNLLSNAIDACKVGGKILVDSGWQNGRYHVSVEDDGGGVPDELLPKIFMPFFTTKQDVGTGLGLWVTKDIVQKYAGAITVTNSKSGAVFQVEIPADISQGSGARLQ